MIRFQRSAQLKRGKHGVKWAMEITDYINTHYPKIPLQFFRTHYGDVYTIYWMADFEDIVALDEWQKQVGADKGYRELRRQSFDILVDGSFTDTVMISAP
jgi:hypothetical protein